MSYYADIALDDAISEARREYDWDMEYELNQEEQSGRHTIYHYRVYVQGQYAYEAEEFFNEFNFYSVDEVMGGDYDSVLHVEIKD